MGAWATGLTMAIALEKRGLVKATGPDVDKVLNTIAQLGPGYRYLLVGYPPFIKVLLDEGERRGIDWSAHGVRLEDVAPASGRRLIRMPYLYVFGRKDSTVSVMGANIYPEDVESAIYAEPDLVRRILSFQLSLLEETPGETRPKLDVQLVDESPTESLRAILAAAVTDRVRSFNRDYREAFGEYPALMPFVVELHRRAEGPFAGTDRRIKFRYVAKA
jgi:phenylacetate-CoA ligase